ncbi:MAG TPA: SRPBCC domain-containing protein [Mycobacteriales bacterium]|nr:SRPBCC domain-containing protein [Mycobacteriales bacterium]
MTSHRNTSSAIEFPSALELRHTRAFNAPIQLVFDVFTKPEHLRKTFPPYGEQMTVCDIDLRVGGDYHFVFVTADGDECSFRGTFLEVEPPTRSVQTWLFDGWPDAHAVETMELNESDGVTTMTYRMVFNDQAGRDHMDKTDGVEASFENVDTYLRSLVGSTDATAG